MADYQFCLYFDRRAQLELVKTTIRHQLTPTAICASRGRLPFSKNHGNFQWSKGVRALSILSIQACISKLIAVDDSKGGIAAIKGEHGSLAHSLDLSISRQPYWIKDVFGVDNKGRSLVRRFINRHNSGLTAAGPVTLKFSDSFLKTIAIKVFIGDCEVDDPVELQMSRPDICPHFCYT